MKKRKKQDPRITVRTTSLQHVLLLFFIVLFVCSSYIGIFVIFKNDDKIESNDIYFYIIMFTYLVLVSMLLMLTIVMFRRYTLQRPIEHICEAARKVAQGDYSVYLESMRHDGKKDEFEVLIEDFNTMTAELASTELLKKDFISNVSHEMKTPLAVIQNYSTLLQSEGISEEERRQYAKIMGDAAQRMTVMITNILQLSRLDNQKIPVISKRYNLSEQLSRCAIEFEYIWEEKNIAIDVDLDQNIVVNNDEALLDIVWNNLISNALKFTNDGGNIRISSKQNQELVIVTVSDTGCGMDAEVLPHIFDQFFQADISHATNGNGLGLALVKSIMDLIGGEISVESVPNIGTTFSVKLINTI